MCATSSTAASPAGSSTTATSHVLALGYIGMTLGSYRWLRPHGRRTAKEIAVEFSTALLRGLIRDETVRVDSPLGIDVESTEGTRDAVELELEPVHDVVVAGTGVACISRKIQALQRRTGST